MASRHRAGLTTITPFSRVAQCNDRNPAEASIRSFSPTFPLKGGLKIAPLVARRFNGGREFYYSFFEEKVDCDLSPIRFAASFISSSVIPDFINSSTSR
jgi:hypothetical protein